LAESDPRTTAAARSRFDAAGVVVAVLLLVVAALIAWDATRLPASVYGMGPAAAPYGIAIGLAALALGTVVAAFTGDVSAPEEADWSAVLLILGGLAAMIAIIGLGGGFIPAVAVLFVTTASAMGRRKPLVDFLIGAALGLLSFLMFSKLLSLSLPSGPLERLL
jgi:putative tricarboxylic transport membrane protein